MSGFVAVSAVSEALELLLTDELSRAGLGIRAQRHMLQPPPSTAQPLLTIFLYDIGEDATVRNRPAEEVVDTGGIRRVRRPPVPLTLRYMLTPWSTDPGDVHQMLGCTVAALQDSRTVLGHRLRQLLAGNPRAADSIADVEVLSLHMAQLTLDEKSRIWWAIQQPFHLSVMYELRVLSIDRLAPVATAAGQVVQRSVDTRLPEGATS